jgi:hypothetical protein
MERPVPPDGPTQAPSTGAGLDAGPGWTLAAAIACDTTLLVGARFAGAGGYGAAAVPLLLGYFVLCGVLAARAAATVVRAAPSVIVVPVAIATGAVALVGSARAWALTPSAQALLPHLLAWAAVPGAAWALTAPRRQRAAAVATAVVTVGWWVVGLLFDR